MIQKELFVEVLNNLQIQFKEDEKNKEILKEAFCFQDAVSVIYNNSKLYKMILKLLQIHFPKDKNGHCEIEHWAFCCNFGKPNLESEYESPEALYDRLIKSK